MIKIDKRKAIELLEAAVAERGADYVYGDHFTYCEYTDSRKEEPVAACVVGVALEKAGVPLEALAEASGSVAELADSLEVYGHAHISKNAVKIMLAAQGVQDASTSGLNAVTHEVVPKSEQTWGKALEAAKAVAGV